MPIQLTDAERIQLGANIAMLMLEAKDKEIVDLKVESQKYKRVLEQIEPVVKIMSIYKPKGKNSIYDEICAAYSLVSGALSNSDDFNLDFGTECIKGE